MSILKLALLTGILSNIALASDRGNVIFGTEAKWTYENQIKNGSKSHLINSMTNEQINTLGEQLLKNYESAIDRGEVFERVIVSEKAEDSRHTCFRETRLLVGENEQGVLFKHFGFVRYINFISGQMSGSSNAAILYRTYECFPK